MADAPLEFGDIYAPTSPSTRPRASAAGPTERSLTCCGPGSKRDGQYTPPWMVKLPNISDEDLRLDPRLPALG